MLLVTGVSGVSGVPTALAASGAVPFRMPMPAGANPSTRSRRS
ncbi:hypothetical protein [Streptomyces vietnamensis]